MVITKGSCLRAKTDAKAESVIVDPLIVHVDGDTVWAVDDCDDLYRRLMSHFVENYVELDRLNEGEVGDYSEAIAKFIKEADGK